MSPFNSYYFIAAAPGTKKASKTIAADMQPLYTTAKALLAIGADSTDATHLRCDGRAIAFFCKWENKIKPMFGASDEERSVLNDWNMTAR